MWPVGIDVKRKARKRGVLLCKMDYMYKPVYAQYVGRSPVNLFCNLASFLDCGHGSLKHK